jgi:RimJ/RimL family protein N-acetyltransferase
MGEHLGQLVALTDDRLLLRPWDPGDVPVLVDLVSDPEIPRWTYISNNLDETGARTWIARMADLAVEDRSAVYAVTERFNGEVVGSVGLGNFDWRDGIADVFYWIGAPHRGRGLATDGVRLIADWGFDTLGVRRIQLFAHPDNIASHAVALRAGFSYEGTLRSATVNKGERWDMKLFSFLPEDRDARRWQGSDEGLV